MGRASGTRTVRATAREARPRRSNRTRARTRTRTRGRTAAALLLAAAGLTGIGPPSRPAIAREARSGPPARMTRATVPDAIADRYLAHRPTLGPVTVVDVSNESTDRRLLAATLQGIVNRTQARIYLVGARAAAEDQYWLDSYEARGLIHVTATVGLDQALATFAGELAGYVLASASEPWTINTATTVAGAEGGVVATPDTVGALTALGVAQLADHRGRWPDAITAYEAIAAAYRKKLAYPGVAIEKPDANQPRDFFVQQGILTVFTRPPFPDFDRVYKLIETFPSGHPVYGYVSDTGSEETEAIVRLARTGRFLVPTDTTDNLSFHIAVGGSERVRAAAPSAAPVAPCTSDTVNVVIAMSDGDNLVIPEAYYPRADRWTSSRRGELPVGWGISPVTSVLMPAVWDHYAETATTDDQLVDLMGLGYSLPSLMPDPSAFLLDSNRLRGALGVTAHWSLDAIVSDPDAPGWDAVDRAAAASGAPPEGIFLNYTSWGGPPWFHTPGGIPVVTAHKRSYDDGPVELAAEIQALVDLPASKRALVNFFPATVWNASYDALVDQMAPLRTAGVRFLTPREAFACLPDAPTRSATTTTSSTAGTASPGDLTASRPDAIGAPVIDGSPTFTG